MSSTWGEKIRISIFGGSHTRAIGVNIAVSYTHPTLPTKA